MADRVIRLTPIFNSRVPAATRILGHLHFNTVEIGIPNDPQGPGQEQYE